MGKWWFGLAALALVCLVGMWKSQQAREERLLMIKLKQQQREASRPKPIRMTPMVHCFNEGRNCMVVEFPAPTDD